jgi:hypothetical protein
MLRVLDSATASKTLIVEPSLACENKLMLLPRRINDRMLHELPKFVESNTDRQEPNRLWLKMLKSDPKRK